MAKAQLVGSDEALEVRKIFCIGRNYAEHAKEMNAAVPESPIFFLKPADGALGAHTYAVAEAYKDFRAVSEKIAKKAGIKAK